MEGRGEDARLVLEYPRAAIALVHVAVDNQDSLQIVVAHRDGGRDAYVVEDAIALAAVGKRVVSAAGNVPREA